MRKNRSVTYGVLNIVGATASLCVSALLILNAIRSLKK